MFLCCSTIKDDTVKPVLRGHLCDKEKNGLLRQVTS
jgi:hypothetical protein